MNLLEELAAHLHYGQWGAAASWFLVFAAFIVFLPYNRKTGRKPTNMYLAFIVASALEMFGIPLSMYFVAWALGIQLPAGLLWGHTLQQSIGYWGMYIGLGLNVVGGALIYSGWKAVYKGYWKSEAGEGKLVTDGIYAYIRHPQYMGFMLMALGLLVHWATIPLLVMWPLLVVQYYRLARREEAEMIAEFGEEYSIYMEKTSGFFPNLSGR